MRPHEPLHIRVIPQDRVVQADGPADCVLIAVLALLAAKPRAVHRVTVAVLDRHAAALWPVGWNVRLKERAPTNGLLKQHGVPRAPSPGVACYETETVVAALSRSNQGGV